jgi:hypothetical protein
MLNVTLPVQEALQLLIYLDVMQSDERDPRNSLYERLERVLLEAGLIEDDIVGAEHDEETEQSALDHFSEQIENPDDTESNTEFTPGTVTFAVHEDEERAILAEL